MNNLETGALADLTGFYELDSRGTVLYAQNTLAEKTAPVSVNIGDNFLELVKKYSDGETLRHHFEAFVGGRRKSEVFTLPADEDEKESLRVSIISVLEKGRNAARQNNLR